ncbi:MAG: nitronate monooxygenase family protein [Salinivirgaceae bacterium]|nr:nitronate monooxygenase family protein [Salinivirgaceae bacterium]MDD4747718.1 nitronate monooxygenase family protein [Salinivirgaceae bacterium]MDY0279508.1 nitronate monooxygenase family protein [Salinivirgaceae bacterium]
MKTLKIGGLTIKVPIIQGGMGVGVSLSGLAVAVANEGGVGVISAAGLGLVHKNSALDYIQANIEGLKQEIRLAKEKTKGIIGVNIMVAMSNFADLVKTAISEKADIIFAGAGLPLELPKFLNKDSVTRLVPIVSSGRAAKLICEKWQNGYGYLPDAIVVEGPKAGGHLGFKGIQIADQHFSLEEIVPDVVREVKYFEDLYNKKIPVIAAGGIYTGEDIYNILQMGASGVQMGSRFVTTEECDASPKFKQTYIDATESDIEIIQSPVGMPGRAVRNSFIDKVKLGLKTPIKCPFHCIRTCDSTKSPYCIISALYNAYKGRMENGYAFAGINAFRATKITTVKEVFAELKSDFQAKLTMINDKIKELKDSNDSSESNDL